MRKVYIPNKSLHDFSSAEEYGELVYLSEGSIKQFATTSLYREFYRILKDSGPEDYLLLSGLVVLNVIATTILTRLHGRINLLIFNPGKGGKKSYVERILK